jgi:hypothetical protein
MPMIDAATTTVSTSIMAIPRCFPLALFMFSPG